MYYEFTVPARWVVGLVKDVFINNAGNAANLRRGKDKLDDYWV